MEQRTEIKALLVCGGAGFIGSNFVRYAVEKYPECKIINADKLTYAGNIDSVKDLEGKPNYKFYKADIIDRAAIEKIVTEEKIDTIINFAAETHVDRSIHLGSREFVMANVIGVQTLLDITRARNIKKLLQVSTDEVYGSLDLKDPNEFTEQTPFAPNAPYAAAKAGGDLLCRAYFKTFQTPVIVTHCSNNYGPYQFPEKLIPFLITKAVANEPLPLYGDGKNVRDWLFVLDHVKALDLILHQAPAGEVYNIGGHNEKSNLEIAQLILNHFNLPKEQIVFVTDRPGHDRRYAINASKLEQELGWKPEYKFEEALPKTIEWYLQNKDWVQNILSRNQSINAHIH